MASTNKGIYYPNEYNAPADVPKDMKELAESVDVAIENIETEQNTKINNLATKNVQQDAEIENLNAKDISLEKEIQNLQNQNTQQTTEIETLKSENTLLKSQIPSETVVRETVHLEDSSNMQCYISPLGASKQETREGYNLLPPMVETTTTYEGRTYASDGKGTLNITGSAVNSGGVTFNLEKEITLGEENLYVHLLNNYASGAIGIRFINGNTRLFEIVPTSVNMITDIGTTYAGQTITAIQIYQNSSNNFDMTIQPMICTSNSSLEFEQYGASPSIEHEAPIKSVGDNINLINIEDGTHASAGVTRVIKKGIITVTGTPISVSYNETIATYIAEKTGTYTLLSFKSSINENIRLLYQVNGGSLINSDTEPQVTLNKGDVLTINLRISSTDTITNFILKPKLVLGTSTGAYSPYGQGSIEIYNCNENFLKNKATSQTINGVNFTVNEDGTVVANGTANANAILYLLEDKNSNVTELTLDVGNYVISGCPSGGSFSTYKVDLMKELTGNALITDYGDPASFALTEKTVFKRTRIVIYSGATVNNLVFKPMITKNSIPTNYTPHQSQTKALYTQQPFRSIGDVKDRFVKVDGVWYEEHSIRSLILDGTREWYINNNGYFVLYNVGESSSVLLTSTHFQRIKEWTNQKNNAFTYGTTIYVAMASFDFTTTDEFKAWLAEQYANGTPVIVNYILKTPKLIPCTPEQVEVLESFNTYKNVTNISSDSIGELEVFYCKDIETLNKNYEERILALENIIATLQSATVEEET